ncbi:MAG TPA: hypothetical protein VKA34_15320 [Balneolales bacterium]|nr:hypothetical protein [Balneolales bacterium]
MNVLRYTKADELLKIGIILFEVMFFWGLSSENSAAQTCSCAGPPLLSSQDIASTTRGNLLTVLTFDFHNISNLYSGSEKLTNRSFHRYTGSFLLEADYGITNKLTFIFMLSYVHKERETFHRGVNTVSNVTTNGLGDASLILRYTLHKNRFGQQYEITAGGGVHIPTGESRQESADGIQYQADMQPGTGAWGGILWAHASKTFLPASTINAFAILTYQFNGSNDRYRNSYMDYHFGNFLIGTLGLSNKFGKGFQYTAILRYRNVRHDEINGNDVATTGGRWFSVAPGINYQINNRWTARLSGQIPVYQYVNNTQPTTRFTTSVSLFYSFKKNPFSF